MARSRGRAHDGHVELLDTAVDLGALRDAAGRPADLLDAGAWLADEPEGFEDYVARRSPDLVRLAAVLAPDPRSAHRAVVAALATAYREWKDGGLTDAHLDVLGALCARLPHSDDKVLVPGPPRSDEGADGVRRSLWRMMPRDRMAGALHHVLGLDERAIGLVMRTPWLHAAAALARAEARGPELLDEAGIDLTLADAYARLSRGAVPTGLAVDSRRSSRRRSTLTVTAGVAVVAALVGLGAAAASAGLGHAPPDASPVAGPGLAVPSRPEFSGFTGGTCREPANPGDLVTYSDTPVAPRFLLRPADLGAFWAKVAGRTERELPVRVVPGHYPVAPGDQAAATTATLVHVDPVRGGATSLTQTVLRYSPGTSRGAYARARQLLGCAGPRYASESVMSFHNPSSSEDGHVFRHFLLPGTTLTGTGRQVPLESWEVLIRVGDRISVAQVTGGFPLSHDQQVSLMYAMRDRLAGESPSEPALER